MEEGTAVRNVSFKRIAKFFLWLFAGTIGLIVVLAAAIPIADMVHWQSTRRDFLQDPGVKVFPKPLPDTSLATAQGITTLRQSGCSVDLPWSNATVQKYGVSLPDGRAILLVDPAKEIDEAGIYRGEQGIPSAVPIFGAATLQSNYDFLAAQLNFDPAELTRLPYGRKHDQQVTLAIGKSTMMLVHKHQPIYNVAVANIRGFQFGDPSQADGFVELRVFDPKDRQFQVRVSPGTSRVPWTQPQINFIIHSMRCDDAAYSAARRLQQ